MVREIQKRQTGKGGCVFFKNFEIYYRRVSLEVPEPYRTVKERSRSDKTPRSYEGLNILASGKVRLGAVSIRYCHAESGKG